MKTRETKSRTGKVLKIAIMSQGEYQAECDNDAGICLGCMTMTSGVEPDARKYDCEACGEARVYGLEEALMMGRVAFS